MKFNLCPDIGLANGSTGKVVDIKYQDDESPQNKNIPYCVWVDMDDYTGPPFFPHTERKKMDTDIYTNTYETIQEKGRLGGGAKDYDSIEIGLGLDHPQIPRPNYLD